MRNKRLLYLLAFAILVTVEALIALFAHDRFVRPYLGDVFVVLALYCLVRVFAPEGLPRLPLYIFLFASAVELAQLAHMTDVLGVKSPILRIAVGGVFDAADILCYAAGCLLLALHERGRR